MKIKQIIKDIDGVFIPPEKKYYFGRIKFYTPYFKPWGFDEKIIRLRYQKHNPDKKVEPMVRRLWNKSFTFLNYDFWIGIGKPWAMRTINLGWKDKFDSPRYEWGASFQIWLFYWQFVIYWQPPFQDFDRDWEMVLWYLYYSDKNLKKAEKTWGWVDGITQKSTWNSKYLIK